MRRLRLVGLMVAFCRASYGSLLDYAGKLPECGLTCSLEHIPLSACKVVTNDTCLCNDENLRASVETCLFERCERMDAIDVARLEAKACKRPIRNRKIEILAPIVIQVIGLLMVPLRLYARWTTVHRIETDDWIVAFCALVFIVFVVFGQLAGWVAFGEDIWMVKPDKLTFGLKVRKDIIVVLVPFFMLTGRLDLLHRRELIPYVPVSHQDFGSLLLLTNIPEQVVPIRHLRDHVLHRLIHHDPSLLADIPMHTVVIQLGRVEGRLRPAPLPQHQRAGLRRGRAQHQPRRYHSLPPDPAAVAPQHGSALQDWHFHHVQPGDLCPGHIVRAIEVHHFVHAVAEPDVGLHRPSHMVGRRGVRVNDRRVSPHHADAPQTRRAEAVHHGLPGGLGTQATVGRLVAQEAVGRLVPPRAARQAHRQRRPPEQQALRLRDGGHRD
ncbi:CFEM domain-containing protein [Colletotrichum graminicola]|nr:CFEM domain-containing protein [Colletotrichum graminicola]